MGSCKLTTLNIESKMKIFIYTLALAFTLRGARLAHRGDEFEDLNTELDGKACEKGSDCEQLCQDLNFENEVQSHQNEQIALTENERPKSLIRMKRSRYNAPCTYEVCQKYGFNKNDCWKWCLMRDRRLNSDNYRYKCSFAKCLQYGYEMDDCFKWCPVRTSGRKQCFCQMYYSPVRCSNGKSYSNDCQATCDNAYGCVPESINFHSKPENLQ